MLNGTKKEIHGVTFLGLGGEIPTRSNAEWNEGMEEREAENLLLNAGDYNVLVTHTPPYGYCDLQSDGTHEGSKAITSAIENSSPSLCLCGHIHHSWGSILQLNDSTVHNVGPNPCWHVIKEKN